MTLKPGTWLNHYEVLNHLGTGGMGEVYRARDNKLQREVALKVLPQAFAQDPERVARFRREAQVLAQVNHPNIAAIYSVEESDGTHFLVMELAQGETLKERIQRAVTSDEWRVTSEERTGREEQTGTSPRHKLRAVATPGKTGGIPIEEALEIAKQIAAGLEAAHEKPIVHRDLKPANVKVTPEGVVKILDFGLARAFSGDSGSGDPADSPTLSAMTAPGTILGTAAYMSPEQARGKKVDKRTDIWALGCVLFEMLTGKHAFEGEDEADILAGVMRGEPDWTALPATTPPNVRFVLRRCLEKDPKRRLSSAADLQIQMEESLSAPAASATTVAAAAPAISPPPLWRRAMPWAAAFAFGLVVAGIGVWSLMRSSAPAPQIVTRFAVPLPPGQQLTSLGRHLVALSPDGTHLVYVANNQLHLRAMGELESTPIRGTEEGVVSPFFSPDGQWVGFAAFDGTLKKVPITGGAPVTLAEIGPPYGATWGTDDVITFGQGADGIWQVPGSGGTKQVLVTSDSMDRNDAHGPEILPGGKAVLFTARRNANWDDSQIVVQDLETGERRVLVEGGTDGRYVPTGHLAYFRDGTLFAVPFDPERLEVTGGPVPIVEGVMGTDRGQTGAAHFGFSRNGSLIYLVRADSAQAEHTLVWVDRQGSEEPLGAPPRAYGQMQLSPDGRQLAVRIGVSTATQDIWVYDLERGALSRLTFEGGKSRPLWTTDGEHIVYRAATDWGQDVSWKPADGSGEEEQITMRGTVALVSSISPDGKLAFYYTSPTEGRDLWMVPLEGDRKPSPFFQGPFEEVSPKISPDGRWVAYISDESGRKEIFVRPFPAASGKWQISTEGGGEPVWARNGRELFYKNDDKMMAVNITTEPAFQAGTPRMLFEGNYLQGNNEAYYDVSLDDQRFLMIKPDEQGDSTAPQQINVVLNWFEELKRRVPAAQ